MDICSEDVCQALATGDCWWFRTHSEALYATLFAGLIEPATGCLTFINAGHNPPLIVFNGAARFELAPQNPLVGVVADINYQVDRVEINPGETLLVYSDWVEDAQDIQRSDFGKESLDTAIRAAPPSATAIVAAISDGLSSFRGDQERFDDITLLAIHRQAGKIEG